MRSEITTKTIKQRCRNRTRIWRRKILRKKKITAGWRRGAVCLERRIRRFRRGFGENRPVKVLNTPEPAYGRGRQILRRKRPCRQPSKRSLEIGIWSTKLSRIGLQGSFFSAWRVFGRRGRHLGGHGGSLGVILGLLGSILGSLGDLWGLLLGSFLVFCRKLENV